MNGRELIDQICLLGAREREQFDHDFQQELVYSAINRAISEVNRLFPVKKTIQLIHYPIRPKEYHKGITIHRGGEDTVFNASDIKSLAFAVSGTGRYRVVAEGCAKTLEGSWQDATQLKSIAVIMAQSFIEYDGGEVTVTFSGDHNYMISDLSFYGATESDIVEDVHVWSKWIGYDIKSKKYAGGNFLGFASLPVRSYEVSLNNPTDYRIDGSVVFLPSDKEGVYTVDYYVRFAETTADTVDNELELDFRLHDLVALRAAYYVYMVDDEEVAAQCNNEYQKNLSIVLTTMPKVETPRKFRDVRGW